MIRAGADHNFGFAALGFTAVIVALGIALLNVGPEYALPGGLFWSALPMTVALLLIPTVRVFTFGWRATMHAENLLMLALVHWILLDLLQETYPLPFVDQVDVQYAFIAIAAMAAGIWLGVMLPAPPPPAVIIKASRIEFGARKIFRAIVICFVLATFNYVYQSDFDPVVIWNGLGAPRFGAPWSRGALGGWSAFLDQLQYFGFVLPSLTVMLAVRKRKWISPLVIVAILLCSVFLAFQIQAGGRRVIGMILGAALLTWLMLTARISIARLILIGATLIGIVTLLQIVLYMRSVGMDVYMNQDSERYQDSSYYHVDDNFLRLAQIVHFFPNVMEYVGAQQIVYAIALPIPRVLWPGKPVDAGYSLTGMLGRHDVTLTSSIVGELYASWGLMAVLMGGIVLGFLAKSWSAILYLGVNSNGKVIYSLGVMVLFVGMRSLQDLVILSYGIGAWIIVGLVVTGAKRRAVRRRRLQDEIVTSSQDRRRLYEERRQKQ